MKDFGYHEMIDKNSKKEDLKIWYDSNKHKQYNFQNEILYYCLTDVLILTKGCLSFRDLFLKIKNIHPFQYITIAQVCTEIYMSMINDNEIGFPKINNFADVYSEKSIKWLEYISYQNKISIQHAKRGGERTITKWEKV